MQRHVAAEIKNARREDETKRKKSEHVGFGERKNSQIPFPSLAGQTVIVNRAVLPTSDLRLSAPSQKKFPVT